MKKYALIVLSLMVYGNSIASYAEEPKTQSDNDLMPMYLTEPMAEHHKARMRKHLETLQQITEALAGNNFDAAYTHSLKFGGLHKGGQRRKKMSAATPGILPMAEYFHQSAEDLQESIKAGDMQKALRAMSVTMQSCTSCHQVYQHKIISQEEWGRRVREQKDYRQPNS